jgi:hypothetical protein
MHLVSNLLNQILHAIQIWRSCGEYIHILDIRSQLVMQPLLYNTLLGQLDICLVHFKLKISY